jgi:hypothetical protein
MHKLAVLIILVVAALEVGWAQAAPGAKATPLNSNPAAAGAERLAAPGPTEPSAKPAPVPQAELLSEPTQVPLEVLERSISFQPQPLTRVFGLKLQTDGVLPQVKRADNPLQLLNPFAPAHYGSGFEHLAINPISGRAEGICLFALRF